MFLCDFMFLFSLESWMWCCYKRNEASTWNINECLWSKLSYFLSVAAALWIYQHPAQLGHWYFRAIDCDLHRPQSDKESVSQADETDTFSWAAAAGWGAEHGILTKAHFCHFSQQREGCKPVWSAALRTSCPRVCAQSPSYVPRCLWGRAVAHFHTRSEHFKHFNKHNINPGYTTWTRPETNPTLFSRRLVCPVQLRPVTFIRPSCYYS